jgi:HK97 family phage portal protein
MGFINKIIGRTNKKTIVSPTGISKDGVFVPVSEINSLSWSTNEYGYLRDYLEVPEVNSIINIKARAFSNMKLEIVSKSTGMPVKNNEPLVKKLRQPNYFQSQKEFLMQTKLYQEIFGNEIIYFLTPTAFKNSVKGMFTLPPLYVDIDELTSANFWLYSEFPENVKYYIDWAGRREYLDPNDIIHINNSKVDVTHNNVYWGDSALRSLSASISNIRAAYEARNVMIENRGALGILSNEGADAAGSLPLDPEEKEKLQNEYKKYGITKNKHQLIITSLKLRYQQMAIDADKLRLFEEVKADTEQICDAFGVPFELLANQKGTTFENQKTAEKRFYTGTIIPEAVEWVDALNRHFETMDKSWEVMADYSHLEVFSENIKERAQTLNLLISGLSKAFLDGALSKEDYQKELAKLKIGL